MTEQSAPPADQPLEIQAPSAEQKSKYLEGQVLSINYTATGPVKVVWRGGKQLVEHQQPDLNPQVPGGMKRKELLALYNFCNIQAHLLREETRKVPVMLKEIEQVMQKTALKGLAHKGLIEIQTLTIVNDDKKKQSYAFCWLTGLGLGVKNQFESAQAQAVSNISPVEPIPLVEPVQEAAAEQTP